MKTNYWISQGNLSVRKCRNHVLYLSLQDWRVHVEQMHQHKEGIENSLKDTKSYLDKLYDEITRTLEKIASREKYINSQLEHHLQVTFYEDLIFIKLSKRNYDN